MNPVCTKSCSLIFAIRERQPRGLANHMRSKHSKTTFCHPIQLCGRWRLSDACRKPCGLPTWPQRTSSRTAKPWDSPVPKSYQASLAGCRETPDPGLSRYPFPGEPGACVDCLSAGVAPSLAVLGWGILALYANPQLYSYLVSAAVSHILKDRQNSLAPPRVRDPAARVPGALPGSWKATRPTPRLTGPPRIAWAEGIKLPGNFNLVVRGRG